jgi:hypothetical protein
MRRYLGQEWERVEVAGTKDNGVDVVFYAPIFEADGARRGEKFGDWRELEA